MAVDDHGIEAIRKSADELTPGDLSNYILKIKGGIADGSADAGGPLKVGTRTVDQASALPVTIDSVVADMISDLYRRLHINRAFNIGGQVVADTVTITAAQVDTTPLAGRQKIYIQNQGNQSIFLGFTSAVTSLTGLEIPRGFMFDDLWGESIPVFLISGTGTQAIRFLEVG